MQFQMAVFAKQNVDIHVTKTTDSWHLTYTTDTFVNRIAFISNPDDSRSKRWKPISNEFEIIYHKSAEFIQKKDGEAFNLVELSLTPTYVQLPKAYAPFAPYSDGGALIHTGRLFACIDVCADEANGWQLTIKVEDEAHIIANGNIYNKSASWLGYDDGQYVYIGQQVPINEPAFIALVDTKLPDDIKVELNQSLPKIMDFFASNLGVHSSKIKPMLFASYSNTPGKDIQGGTLPNQVFIHWDMDNLNDRLKDKDFISDTLWMFAHEASHFFQDSSALINDKSESWIHEGNAEWLAAIALREFYPDIIEPFIEKKLNEARTKCANALARFSLVDAAKNGAYRAYYQCGMIIHSLVDKKARELSQGKYSIFNIWSDFKEQGGSIGKTGAKGFWSAAEKYISDDLNQSLRQLTTDELANPTDYIRQLELR